jgi:hypothetical protein
MLNYFICVALSSPFYLGRIMHIVVFQCQSMSVVIEICFFAYMQCIFVSICVLLQSILHQVNLYLNITVPLKLWNGTTSHVVFCYAKKSDSM